MILLPLLQRIAKKSEPEKRLRFRNSREEVVAIEFESDEMFITRESGQIFHPKRER